MFQLTESFIEPYKRKKTPFGFNGLGEIVYYRTYSRVLPSGKNERWWETVRRVVEGTYNMQKAHIDRYNLGWNGWTAQKSAQEMYDRIFNMKFLPPGRGLWAMGSTLTQEKKLYAALNNCSFVSTADLKSDLSKPFCFLMDLSMLGVGVGFDTLGANTMEVFSPDRSKTVRFEIPDSREGWVESVRLLLESYFRPNQGNVEFDYGKIRPEGSPILGFGGVSSGPEPLIEGHVLLRRTLDKNAGKPITVRTIVDVMNILGKVVVSGNVRRSAEIAFGGIDDHEFIQLKDYSKNPDREAYGWSSNNSVLIHDLGAGVNYKETEKHIRANGEPGFAWLPNMQAYSRMDGKPNWRDRRARGGNPCLEQTLESYELCCLVETFPNNHTTLEDYLRTLKYAYLYAKTVTLGQTHWPDTNRVMLRNRRIGCSVSGVVQFLEERGIESLRSWLNQGYDHIQRLDEEYSNWFAVPRSIKTTSVKPSGTVSLLAGATPGMHWPESEFYIRRIRINKGSQLIEPLQRAGFKVEPCFGNEETTLVVDIPVSAGAGRSAKEVSMWEQLSLAAFLQREWADNQVSCTVTFNPETEGPQIANALNFFQYQLKGVSFLPRHAEGAYPQMPYESITREQYEKLTASLKPLKIGRIVEEAEPEQFCDGDTCQI